MSAPRVDSVSGPLVVGQLYLVRTVRAQFFGVRADWPVIGPKHEDVEFFNFDKPHYHVDHRFVRCSDNRAVDRAAWVLHGWPERGLFLPPPRWSRRKCVRTWFASIVPTTRHVDIRPLVDLRKAFAGKQCDRGVGGFICPHRQAPLGSVEPVNGVITCPLHNLRIDAATGVVLPA